MRRQSGFTLLEVLVALVLLGIFALSSYRALNAVLDAERQAVAEMARWGELARAFSRLEADLADAAPAADGSLRGFRDHAGAPGGVVFAFDRLLPEDGPVGVQRLEYRYADGRLSRRPADAPTGEVVLLRGLRSFAVRYLDERGSWRTSWRVEDAALLPRALEVTLELAGGERLRRVFRTR